MQEIESQVIDNELFELTDKQFQLRNSLPELSADLAFAAKYTALARILNMRNKIYHYVDPIYYLLTRNKTLYSPIKLRKIR